MKTVAIIPARAGSRGVPGKNVKDLGGRPLLAWTIEAALKTPNIDQTYVTTESEEYAEVAKKYGAEVLMRPPELSTEAPQTDEVFLYALRQLQYRGIQADTLVLLQPTSPFRTWRDVQRALELYHEKGGEKTIFAGYRSHGYYWYLDDDEDFMPIRHDPIFRLPRQAYKDSDWLIKESGAIYIVSAKKFSEYRSYRIPPFYCYIMNEEDSLDIDVPADFEQAIRMVEKG